MDLDELMDELRKLDGRDVSIGSHGHALSVGGALKVRQVMDRVLPEDTAITGELYFSLPAKPSTDTVGFTIGDYAQVMFMREWFVSAEAGFRQIHPPQERNTLPRLVRIRRPVDAELSHSCDEQ